MAEAIAQICRTCRGDGRLSQQVMCFGIDADAAAKMLAAMLVPSGEVQTYSYECGECGGKGFRRDAVETRDGDGGHAQGSGVADQGEGALNEDGGV